MTSATTILTAGCVKTCHGDASSSPSVLMHGELSNYYGLGDMF